MRTARNAKVPSRTEQNSESRYQKSEVRTPKEPSADFADYTDLLAGDRMTSAAGNWDLETGHSLPPGPPLPAGENPPGTQAQAEHQRHAA